MHTRDCRGEVLHKDIMTPSLFASVESIALQTKLEKAFSAWLAQRQASKSKSRSKQALNPESASGNNQARRAFAALRPAVFDSDRLGHYTPASRVSPAVPTVNMDASATSITPSCNGSSDRRTAYLLAPLRVLFSKHAKVAVRQLQGQG